MTRAGAEGQREWQSIEPGMRAASVEGSRLFRRAAKRRYLTIFITLAVVSLAVLFKSQKPRQYHSKIVFRVEEDDVDVATSPRPKKHFREYVLGAVYSNENLLKLIRQYDLYPSSMRKGTQLALESMRDDIEVDIWRNYFLEERRLDDPARSARLSVEYQAPDPQIAQQVAAALGQLILDEQGKTRAEQVRRALEALRRARKRHLTELELRRRHLAETREKLSRARPQEVGRLTVEVLSAGKGADSVELRLQTEERDLAALELRQSVEQNKMGMRFEVIESPQVEEAGVPRNVELAMIAVVLLLVVYPLTSIGVGAFDWRVYDASDVERLSLRMWGIVPSLPPAMGEQALARLRSASRAHRGGPTSDPPGEAPDGREDQG